MTIIGNPLIIGGGGGSTVTLQTNKNVSITSNTTTIVTPDTGYDGMEQVTVTTNVPVSTLQSSKNVTISASGTTTVDPDTGYDAIEQVNVSVPAGSATTPSPTITATPIISVSSNGLITASVNKAQSITPTVSPGWVSSGTAGTIFIAGSNTSQLTTKAAATYTPTTSDQTIASGQYLTGAQTIEGDANLIAGNIKKDVSIFGVTGTYEASGGSSYTLLATQDITVNTTSTSATLQATIQLGSSAYTDASILYVKVRDKAGIRSGYYIGSDNYIFNYRAASGQTNNVTQVIRYNHTYSSGTYTSTNTTGTTAYGIYAYDISSAGALRIYSRYNSSTTRTINGTYEIKVYALAYAPTQGNPYDYSY